MDICPQFSEAGERGGTEAQMDGWEKGADEGKAKIQTSVLQGRQATNRCTHTNTTSEEDQGKSPSPVAWERVPPPVGAGSCLSLGAAALSPSAAADLSFVLRKELPKSGGLRGPGPGLVICNSTQNESGDEDTTQNTSPPTLHQA